ncbi:hypothetical protein, partial [Microcoleus sp. D3_18cC1]|uniref:hypothetical protein n=1 Tax=Microcoleus sp. D3_18cC1 TaxID=3055336 RepID=UPI002FD33BC7
DRGFNPWRIGGLTGGRRESATSKILFPSPLSEDFRYETGVSTPGGLADYWVGGVNQQRQKFFFPVLIARTFAMRQGFQSLADYRVGGRTTGWAG